MGNKNWYISFLEKRELPLFCISIIFLLMWSPGWFLLSIFFIISDIEIEKFFWESICGCFTGRLFGSICNF